LTCCDYLHGFHLKIIGFKAFQNQKVIAVINGGYSEFQPGELSKKHTLSPTIEISGPVLAPGPLDWLVDFSL
jgi:hypothetical protein